jgi:LmbE family N-acetylglucosaminyl deacetylase
MSNILVVSPHMDDETIGAGGTLLRYTGRGHDAFWLNIANSKTAYGYPEDLVRSRLEQHASVKNAYGFAAAYDLALEPARLDAYADSDVLPQIAQVVGEVKPEILILPYAGDIHSDHGRVSGWMKPFTKAFRYPSVRTVLAMEILSETDFALGGGFVPDYYVDITDQIDRKIEIARMFEDEVPERDFPRSAENVRALAQLRGSVAGVKYAEAFKLLRHIEK